MFFSKHILNNYLPKLLLLSLLASTAFAYSGGTGEPNSPYQIGSVSDWNDLMNTSADWNKNFILTADVNLLGVTVTPVGNTSTPFTGFIDGNSHKISNITISLPFGDYVGLFGYISGAQINNLGAEDVNIAARDRVGGLVGYSYYGIITSCYTTGPVSGYRNVGGLVGYNYHLGYPSSTITSCYATGSISGTRLIGGLVGYNCDSNITDCYATGSVSGYQLVGGLVGECYQSIVNSCRATGSVTGTSDSAGGLVGENYQSIIISCYATGSVSGKNYVGGLAGESGFYSAITASYATGSVSGESYIGGLTGENYYFSTITSCCATGLVTATGSYVGGLVAENYGTITNCYSTGEISGNSYVGGLVGQNPYSITNCYSAGAVSGTVYVGGLVGYGDAGDAANSFWDVNASGQTTSAGGRGLTTNRMKSVTTYQNDSWADKGWVINDGLDYPRLAWQNTGGIPIPQPQPIPLSGSGTEQDPYQISTVDDFALLNQYISALDKHFILSSDLDLSGITLFPIGYNMGAFTGVFDGKGHIVHNLDINSPADNIGLFSSIGPGGIVRDLGFENIQIITAENNIGALAGINYGTITNCYAAGAISGYEIVGGLVGFNYGSISNCYSTISVSGFVTVGGLCGLNAYDGSITNCYSTGAVNGDSDVGGLAGSNSGSSISNCYSTGAVNGSGSGAGGLVSYNYGSISNCYSTGEVNGLTAVGGLVASNDGSISNCYSTSAVSGDNYVGGLAAGSYGIIINCYSTGAIVGDSNVGGLVGNNHDQNNVIASFWDVNTSGWSTSDGGTGKTTAEMKTLSTFTSAGWDFSYSDGNEAVWFMPSDEYPILPWQISDADIYIDGRNNFKDFAVLARFWMRNDCRRYNSYCQWADLNFDGSVDIDDLAILMSYWLQSGIYE